MVGRDVDRGQVGVASEWIFLFFLFFFNIFFLDFIAQFFFFFLVIAIVDLGAPKLVTFSPPSGPAARKDGGERML